LCAGVGKHAEAFRPVLNQQIGRRRVPGILTDEESRAAEPRLRTAEKTAAGKMAGLLKQPVGGQIHLAVNVPNLPLARVDRRVVKQMPRSFLDQADRKSVVQGKSATRRRRRTRRRALR